MTIEVDGLDGFKDQITALERTIGSATSMTTAFSTELSKMNSSLTGTSGKVDNLSRGISNGLRGAFDGLIFDGISLSDALSKVANSMVNAAYSAAIKPVTNHFGGLLATGIGALFGPGASFANGAGFTQGRVMPFANGGVVSSPTTFPMRGGTGLMGEAGPEAIMPLTRGANGRLGVEMNGAGRSVNITMNISTPDVAGFQRSQSQIAAQLSRALGRGQRNN